MMYRALRWIVSLVYLTAVVLAFMSAMSPGDESRLSFPLTLLLFTASYAILIVLILLHERFRPPQ